MDGTCSLKKKLTKSTFLLIIGTEDPAEECDRKRAQAKKKKDHFEVRRQVILFRQSMSQFLKAYSHQHPEANKAYQINQRCLSKELRKNASLAIRRRYYNRIMPTCITALETLPFYIVPIYILKLLIQLILSICFCRSCADYTGFYIFRSLQFWKLDTKKYIGYGIPCCFWFCNCFFCISLCAYKNHPNTGFHTGLYQYDYCHIPGLAAFGRGNFCEVYYSSMSDYMWCIHYELQTKI
jgi:hypothetical protein